MQLNSVYSIKKKLRYLICNLSQILLLCIDIEATNEHISIVLSDKSSFTIYFLRIIDIKAKIHIEAMLSMMKKI